MLAPKLWADPWGGGTARPEERIVDDQQKPQWSGLYNSAGQPLYRRPNPIGFETDPSRKFE